MMTRAYRRPSRLVAAAAIFGIACGFVLLAVPRSQDDATVAEAVVIQPRHLVLSGIEETRQARRALVERNYKDARDHLERAEESLTVLLTKIGSEQAPH